MDAEQEKKMIEFGFVKETDPEVLKRYKEEDRKTAEEVWPVWQALIKWQEDSQKSTDESDVRF